MANQYYTYYVELIGLSFTLEKFETKSKFWDYEFADDLYAKLQNNPNCISVKHDRDAKEFYIQMKGRPAYTDLKALLLEEKRNAG